jgi:two-component system response regulator YesN
MDDRLSILVGDDFPFYVDTLAAVLDVHGFIVQKAYSGANALEIIQGHPIDILLTDVNLPGMDRMELYRKTKKIHPSITAILMTSYAPNK